MNARDRDARIESEIAGPLRAAGPILDELHRARLTSAIEAALDHEDEVVASRRARRDGGRRWRVSILTAGIAAAAALAAVILFRGPRTPPQTDARVAHAPAATVPPLLRPHDGVAEEAPPPALAPSTSLLALAGERARATIAGRVKLTLIGPGRISVLSAGRAGDVELALDGGRLLVDYDGHAGRSLRVRSPGFVTIVVGTLFAVEVTGSGSRVAVARGRVRTEDASGHLWQIAAGSSWTSADGHLDPISDELATALVNHERDWTSGERTSPPEARSADAATRPAIRPSAAAGRVSRPVDLEALYAEAEAAMRVHSGAEARRALETVVDHDRKGPLGEAALIDLARLALADGDRAEARRVLARLPRNLADPALAETADHLRCRAAVVRGDGPDREGACTPGGAPASSGAR